MPVTRNPIRNWLEWALVASLLGIMQRLPARIGLGLLRGLGVLACTVVVGRRRRTANLVASVLGLDPSEDRTRRIVRRSFESLALNVFEATYLEKELKRRPLADFVTLEGHEHLDRALADGRGIVLATAHFGAWEAPGPVLGPRIPDAWAVGRSFDNPRLSRLVEERRGQWTAGIIDKSGGGRQIVRLMKRGGCVYMLLDQNAGQKGVVLDFLGRPSLHHRVCGTMAVRYGALVLPLYMYREPGFMRYRLVLEPPIEADPALAGAAAEVDVVRRVSRSLEARVRQDPEQWYWLHDRWRRAERFLVEGPVEHPVAKPVKKGIFRRLLDGTKA